MATQKASGLWIRLSHEEREEIQKEASVSGFNMSEIARQRLFSDPVSRLDRRLDKIEQRSLTLVAFVNLIVELLDAMVVKDKRIGKKLMQARVNMLKMLVMRAESATLDMYDDEEEE